MKKIINGKKYDTETAQCVGIWRNSNIFRDLNYFSETLYRKQTGEFFLHGMGAALSKYAVSCDHLHRCLYEKIIPLDYDAAREWAEEHLDVDDYEAIFGEVVEDESHVSAIINISAAALERAKRAASYKGTELSVYIESLII